MILFCKYLLTVPQEFIGEKKKTVKHTAMAKDRYM